MKHYLYLLAWMDGSDSAGGEKTKVHKQEDLMPQFLQHNEHVFAVAIRDCPSESVAHTIGDSMAFDRDYAAYDSLSIVVEIDEEHEAFDPEYILCLVIDAAEYLECKFYHHIELK